MKAADLFPAPGHVQRLYCDACGGHLDLAFTEFSEDVSGVSIRVSGLPVLRCPSCERDHLPDLSRLALINLHKESTENGALIVNVERRKRTDDFRFGRVSFVYDPDDYFYIPGLFRQFDKGFLTPVFFNREVLLKYDNSPTYRVAFASTTYGTIYMPGDYISFGINRHGRIVMWLGDLAKMPEAEQYYLRSENIPSDHSIGGEFYDGQIEVKFTALSIENALFKARSEFIEACFNLFGRKIAHLDSEVVTLGLEFNGPVVDTDKERRHVADTLNKIYVESFDNAALGEIIKTQGGDAAKLGSLRRLQMALTAALPDTTVAELLSPFYVLYDLRVACSHLVSTERSAELIDGVTTRLNLPRDAGLLTIYSKLVGAMTVSFDVLTEAIRLR